MNSKEKKILIVLMIIAIFMLVFYILANFTKRVVYADTKENVNFKFSQAEKFNVEEIIRKNNNINSEQIITEEIDLEYITQYKNNNELPEGTIQVIQEGRTGKKQITKKIAIDENLERHEEEISSIIITSPANKIVQVGTSKSKKNYKRFICF